jgi:ATP-binding cassette subfamily B multidrug efflux pump
MDPLPWPGRLARNAWLWRYFRDEWRLFGAGAFFLAATHACALAIPWMLRGAVETLRTGSGGAGVYAGGMALAAVGAACVRTLSRTLCYAGGREIEHRLRNELVGHLLRLPLPALRAGRVGDLLSRAQHDTSEVRTLMGPGFLNVTNTAMAYVATTLAMVTLSPRLTFWALLPFPLLAIAFHRLSASMHVLYAGLQKELGDLSARLSESLAGAMVVKCHGIEGREVRDLTDRSRAYLERQLKFALLRSSLWPLVFLISGIGMSLLLLQGGAAVRSGELPLGTLVAFASYYAYLLWPTVGLGWIMNQISRGFAASDRLHELWTSPSEEPTADGTARPARALSVRDLSFTHAGAAAPALYGLSLDLAPGSLVALMGRTGAGKSTLLALLARVLPLPAGAAALDGADLTALPLADARRTVVLVPQEPYLFSQTVLENIRWSDPTATEAQVHDAARAAGLAGDVERLPGGWNARVGEAGVTLSRGQRQRMALARALLADPPVLLLDDPFSAVDTHTEEEILRALVARRAGKLTLVVTHRVSTAALADRVLVLDGGRIAEEGRPAELLARDGLYADLARRQRLDPEARA